VAPPRPPAPPFLERLRGAPVTLLFTFVNVVVFLVAEVSGGTTNAANLLRFGAVEAHHVWAGEYWRLASYMFLHIGWMHLLWNSYASFGWCVPVERSLGGGRFFAVYVLSGLAGGAASTVLPYSVSAGASGAMFGIVGAQLALRRRELRSFAAAFQDPGTRSTLAGIAIWTVIGLTAMPMNNRAHFGGLVAGAIAAWIFTSPRPRVLGVPAALAFAALLVFATRPWMRGKIALPEETAAEDKIGDRLMAECDKGVLAGCYALELTITGIDSTRDLEGRCNDGDLDACAAWGWTLAHGRPGVPKDEPRGRALLADTCKRGNEWGCALARGESPLARFDAGSL
jgi:membrane associated rhomboid family serine protease